MRLEQERRLRVEIRMKGKEDELARRQEQLSLREAAIKRKLYFLRHVRTSDRALNIRSTETRHDIVSCALFNSLSHVKISGGTIYLRYRVSRMPFIIAGFVHVARWVNIRMCLCLQKF
jgi:hypothetical protein